MKYISALLFVFLLLSCSNATEEIIPEIPTPDDGIEKPEDATQKYHLKLGVKKNTMNIFEMFNFYLQDEDRNGLHVSLKELSEVYDSINWVIPGQEGRLKLFSWKKEEGYAEEKLTPSWGHNFYLPGHYETQLQGYKDNQIIYRDTLIVDANNQKDFLMYRWSEIIKDSNYTGYHNAINENYALSAQSKIHGDIPTISMSFWNEQSEEPNIFAPKCEMQLYHYINSMYKQPTYDRDSPALADKYKELFAYKEEAEPRAIWLTSQNKIVLLMSNKDDLKFWIHAEPRNKRSVENGLSK